MAKIKKIVIYITLLLLIAAAVLIAACQKTIDPAGHIEPDSANEVIPEPEPEPAFICPLDGLELDAQPLRPILVSIDNNPKAWPQSGLSLADVVIEVPAEGGISRYLGVFYHRLAEATQIGPVRSTRPYILDLAREYNAINVHIGGSMDAYAYIKKGLLLDWDAMYYDQGFWRDKSRKAPHNLYTNGENLLANFQKREWTEQIVPYSHIFDPAAQGSLDGSWLKVHYPYNKVNYVYDAAKDVYLRSIGEKEDIDQANQNRIAPTNIIIQHVKTVVLDNEGRLKIDLTTGGEAMVFTGGTATKGTWSKAGVEAPTYYYDQSGKEIALRPGQTYIQIVDKMVKIDWAGKETE